MSTAQHPQSNQFMSSGIRRLLMLQSFFISLLTNEFAFAAPSNPTPIQKHIDLTSLPQFLKFKERATEYLQDTQWRRSTSICALGESIDNDQQVWFVWQDGKKIILWDEPDMPLAASRRIINIPRDVVTNKSNVKGSTYKVTQAWVQELTARCTKHGTTFQLSQKPNH
jgi:hypothetical protein